MVMDNNNNITCISNKIDMQLQPTYLNWCIRIPLCSRDFQLRSSALLLHLIRFTLPLIDDVVKSPMAHWIPTTWVYTRTYIHTKKGARCWSGRMADRSPDENNASSIWWTWRSSGPTRYMGANRHGHRVNLRLPKLRYYRSLYKDI